MMQQVTAGNSGGNGKTPSPVPVGGPGGNGKTAASAPPGVFPVIRTRMYHAGRQRDSVWRDVVQTPLVDPGNPVARFMQQCRLPRSCMDDAMILMAHGALAPERRPPNFDPDQNLDLWDPHTGTRLVYARGLLEWGIGGEMVDRIVDTAAGASGWYGKVKRSRAMRDISAADRQANSSEDPYS